MSMTSSTRERLISWCKMPGAGSDPYGLRRAVEILSMCVSSNRVEGLGDIEHDVDGVLIKAPAWWNYDAVRIFASKYLRKAEIKLPPLGYCKTYSEMHELLTARREREGVFSSEGCLYGGEQVPERTNAFAGGGCLYGEEFVTTRARETDVSEAISRVAMAWAVAEVDFGGASIALASSLYVLCLNLMRMQVFSPNSPQWFNNGIWAAYGKEAGSTLHAWCPAEFGHEAGWREVDAFYRPQLHACFIHPVKDNLVDDGGIMDHLKTEAAIFKFGSGSGTNYSRLRAYGSKLSKGGLTSGVMSFLKVGDASAGAIKSGGTTRRSARMLFLDSDHKDILDFVNWKRREEDKVAALVEGSRVLRDGLLEGTGQAAERYKGRASRLEGHDYGWEGAAYQTVAGQNGNNTVRLLGEDWTDSTLLDEIAFNAWACGDPGVAFDETIQKWDTMPELTQAGDPIEATNPCGEFIWRNNTSCNLASINLAAAWARGLKLSALAVLLTNVLDSCVSAAGYPTAAIGKGTTDTRPLGLGVTALAAVTASMGFKYGSPEMLEVTEAVMATVWSSSRAASESRNSWRAEPVAMPGWKRVDQMRGGACQTDLARRIWEASHSGHYECSPMNGQLVAVAPTGTISLVMGCETTGVEPYYSESYYKTLAGGGDSIKVTLNDARGNCVADGSISQEDHLNVVAAVQRFSCGGVSKTVNLPNNATVEDVKSVILRAHQLGLKSVTVYRDGSKYSQPLNDVSQQEVPTQSPPSSSPSATGDAARRPLPYKRRGTTTKAKLGGNSIFIRTGEYPDGRLGELFLDMHKSGATMRSVLHCFAVAVSIGLQYGVPVEEFVEAFVGTKFEPNGMVFGHDKIKIASSIMDLVFRDIGANYAGREDLNSTVDDAQAAATTQVAPSTGDVCGFCGNASVVQTGTCKVCRTCGESSGGCS